MANPFLVWSSGRGTLSSGCEKGTSQVATALVFPGFDRTLWSGVMRTRCHRWPSRVECQVPIHLLELELVLRRRRRLMGTASRRLRPAGTKLRQGRAVTFLVAVLDLDIVEKQLWGLVLDLSILVKKDA